MLLPVLEVPTDPAQPSNPVPPLAVHAVAFDVDQDSDVDWPTTMLFGTAVKVLTLAAGGGAPVTLMMVELLGPVPPAPVQVSV